MKIETVRRRAPPATRATPPLAAFAVSFKSGLKSIDRSLHPRLPAAPQRLIQTDDRKQTGKLRLPQFVLPGLGEFKVAKDPSAIENRLGQTTDRTEERRMRLKQRCQRRALIAALPGQSDTREKLRARAADIGGGGRKLRLLTPYIR